MDHTNRSGSFQTPTWSDGNHLDQRQRRQAKWTITVDNAAVLASNRAMYDRNYRALAAKFGVRATPYSTATPLPGLRARPASVHASWSAAAPDPPLRHLPAHTSPPLTSADPVWPAKGATALSASTKTVARVNVESPSGQALSARSFEVAARPHADTVDLHPKVLKKLKFATLSRRSSGKKGSRIHPAESPPVNSASSSSPVSTALSPSLEKCTEPRLPREILLMIFEELVDTCHLRGMRLVSQQFEDLIVPMMYHHVTLTPDVVREYISSMKSDYSWMDTKPSKENSRPHKITPLYLQMGLYTRDVSVNRNLDLDSVCRLLEDLDGLESLEWSYWDHNDSLGQSLSLNQRYSRANCNERLHDILNTAKTQLHVQRLSVASMPSTWLSVEPPFPLVTFKVDLWRSSDRLDIKPVLLKHPELETIHLIGERKYLPVLCVSFHDWMIRPHERMPAVKELVLENYYWDHSPQTAVSFWTWTRITHLELKNVSMVKFLQTVPPKHLVRLRCLVLDEDIGHASGEATKLMADLVHEIYALERLSLTCKPRRVVTSVLKHGPTLRSLQLYSCFEIGEESWKALSVADLDAINACCPHIMQLGLEVQFRGDRSPASALQIDGSSLSNMRNLRRLNLFARLVDLELPSADGHGSYYHLHTLLQAWLDDFLLAKKGATFGSICIDVRVGEAASDIVSHVSWTYRHGKGLSRPKAEWT